MAEPKLRCDSICQAIELGLPEISGVREWARHRIRLGMSERVAVPRLGVGENAATGLALVIHELATNAMKYGSLSVPEGTLDVSGTITGDAVEIQWTERGGPEVGKPDGPGGYGSKLLYRTLAGHLGGKLEHDWSKEGLVVTLKIDGRRLPT